MDNRIDLLVCIIDLLLVCIIDLLVEALNPIALKCNFLIRNTKVFILTVKLTGIKNRMKGYFRRRQNTGCVGG